MKNRDSPNTSPGLQPLDFAAEPGDVVDLSVIVVSYNTRALTLRCLESLRRHPLTGALEVLVVDNASGDGTVEAIREAHPETRLIANAHNRGFAAANNQALERARGRHVLLLNPDAEVEKGTLDHVLAFIESRPDAGVVACRVRLGNGEQQSTLFRYLRLSTVLLNLFVPARFMRRSSWLGASRYIGLDLDRAQQVEVVAGCFMLLPRAVVEAVGGMDEGFFMYCEEADWCRRITEAGWSVWYTPDSSIVHLGGQSAKQRPKAMLEAMARSQLLFLEKHQGKAAAYLANLLMLLRDATRTALYGVLQLVPQARGSALEARLHPSVSRLGFHFRGLLHPDWRSPPVPRGERTAEG